MANPSIFPNPTRPASIANENCARHANDSLPKRENERITTEVEWRIAAMNGAMMIGTDQHEVRSRVVPSAAKPADMMRFA
jgi:hypothetical protein